MKSTSSTICVFAASSQDIDAAYIDAAHRLGGLLAQRGWHCVNGAGSSGLMRAVTDGVLDHNGLVTGVIPKFMIDNGWCYNRLPEVLVTADMHQRKLQLAQMSDAIVALPGGCGTLEELLEAITWSQLGLHVKPIVLLNTLGYYDPLVSMLHHCIAQGFMRQSHGSLWTVADTPEDAISALQEQLSHPQSLPESKY